jgi:MFS transporter, LPLT family, lysophospholipid transporter
LTELLPPEKLVAANGWIEGTTVGSIILGVVLGGFLVGPKMSTLLLGFDLPLLDTGVDTRGEAAIMVIMIFYIIAALFNSRIPDTGARYAHQESNPLKLLSDFWRCNTILWKDKLGQISLAVTTLFWGAGATLQFIVLEWAKTHLHLPLDQAAKLQGVVAVGIAIGAVMAARYIPLKRSLSVTKIGVAMGLFVPLMTIVNSEAFAMPMLVIIGALAGFFVVPMNALLQHRGHVLMSAGHSIAVQNFNENLNILLMLGIYSLLIKLNVPINIVIILFGLFVAATMLLVMRRHLANQREFDSVALIGEAKH